MEKDSYVYNKEKEEDFLKAFSKARNEQYTKHNIQFRLLQEDDFDRGFPEILNHLSEVGDLTKEQFQARFRAIDPAAYKVVVGVDTEKDLIITSGTVIIELKFIRNLGRCGHIEDIVVREGYEGQNIGRQLIFCLKELSRISMCYKLILDCRQELTKFYGKNGLKQKEIQMVWYNDDVKEKRISSYDPPKPFAKL